jgi:hypothetical protein
LSSYTKVCPSVSTKKCLPKSQNLKAFSNPLHSNFTAFYFLLHSKFHCRIVLVVVFHHVEIDESLLPIEASMLITILPAEEEKSSQINVGASVMAFFSVSISCYCSGIHSNFVVFRKSCLIGAAMIENSKMTIRKYTQIPIDPISTPFDLDVVCSVIVRSMASRAQKGACSRRYENKRDWKDCLCIYR